MRILMLVQSPNIRGPLARLTPLLIKALQDLGCEVQTVQWGRHNDSEALSEKLIERITDLLHARKALERKKYDVVFVNTAHDWATLSRDIPLLLLTRHICPNIVLQFHGSSSDILVAPGNYLFKLFSHWLVSLCDAALVLSSEEQREWQQFYPHGRFDVVCNPFLPDTLEISNFDQRINDVKRDPVILFVGRLIREKGIFDLLDTMTFLQAKRSFRLLIVGDGPDAKAVKQKTAQLNLADRVTFTGYLKGEDLNNVYCNANVFVFPSYWKEGFPTVLAEAMGFGLPIITTRIRGVTDHLQEGVNGLFVPPKDPASLAKAVVTLLNDPVLCTQMGKANQEKVIDFSPEKVGKLYLEVLNELFHRTPVSR